MADHVSVARMMTLCACSATTISAWARDGIVVRAGRNQYDLDASIPRIIQHLRSVASGQSGSEDIKAARARLTRAKADTAEIDRDARAGIMVDVATFRTRWGSEMATLRQVMLGVPDAMARALPHLTKHDADIMDRTMRDALTRCADEAEAQLARIRAAEEAERRATYGAKRRKRP